MRLTTKYDAVLLGLAVTVLLVSSFGMAKAVEKRRFVSIGTGGPKGIYHVVGKANVSEETVYQVVRLVMDNIDAFRQQHPAFAHLDPQKMVQDGLSAPLHPGALRYYQEKG